MKNIIVQGIPVKIVTNLLSRSLKLRLDKQGNAVLTLPKWISQKRGIAFVDEHVEWIKEQQSKQCPKQVFTDGLRIDLLGVPLTIQHRPTARGGVFIQDSLLIVSGESTHLHRRVRDFIKKQGYAYIQHQAIKMATVLGRKPVKITLRDTSSRWGSCSSAGHLSFCWKLALAPTFVLDYIIAHEVAHLVEMNHSVDFWHTVAQIDTHRANAQSWLRKNGTALQAWE